MKNVPRKVSIKKIINNFISDFIFFDLELIIFLKLLIYVSKIAQKVPRQSKFHELRLDLGLVQSWNTFLNFT